MPGQGGMVIATKVRAELALGAKLKRRSERNRQRRPGRERVDPLHALLAAPDAAPPADHKPDLLDRSMRDRMRHCAGGQLEMRHASAGEAQKQAHRRSVRRDSVDARAQRLGFVRLG